MGSARRGGCNNVAGTDKARTTRHSNDGHRQDKDEVGTMESAQACETRTIMLARRGHLWQYPLMDIYNWWLSIGSTCQMPQQIKCICIQVDCWIHSKVPEPIAASLGRPLIFECLFNCQARLHQNQSKYEPANYKRRSYAPFQRRSSLQADCWLQRSKSFQVDCRPIFKSILGGNWIHSKRFMQQASTVDYWIHLHCRIQPKALEHLSARFGRRMFIHHHHFNCQPRNFK